MPRRGDGQPDDEPAGHDLGPVLHEEVDRLPEKYRQPVVLCYLEGQTHEERPRAAAVAGRHGERGGWRGPGSACGPG